jgi:hypothetical protein
MSWQATTVFVLAIWAALSIVGYVPFEIAGNVLRLVVGAL